MSKNPKKCSHIIVFPPAATLKKFAPNIRSNVSMNNATVSGGNAKRISADVTNVVHVNIGILIYVMPGARILIMVTRKLIPPIKVPNPDICDPKHINQFRGLVIQVLMRHMMSNPHPELHQKTKKI